MTPSTPRARRARVGAVLVGLLAPVLGGVAASVDVASASAGSEANSSLGPVQRYITANVNKKEVKKGRKVTISGAVSSDAPACALGVVLNVEQSTSGATYNIIGTVTTDGTGAYSVQEKVTTKSRFRISAPATDACSEIQSPPRTVKILPKG